MIRTALSVLARCWPTLLAWYIAGWVVRTSVVRFAGALGNIEGLWGLLVLPIGVLAQLAAYVGMFLAVRRALPHAGLVDDAVEDAVGRPRLASARRWTDALLTSILPFFVLYVAWGLIRDDYLDYASASLEQGELGEGADALSVPLSAMSVTLVIVAFVLRWALSRFGDRLPRWTAGFSVYLEAVWVLVAILVIRDLLAPVPDWLASRRMFGWAVDSWTAIVDALPWLAAVGDAIGWVVGQFGTLVGLPLAWLAFAAIVYVRAAVRPTPDARTASLRRRWRRLPHWMRRVLTTATAGTTERWQPVADAGRLILHAGWPAIGLYLFAFAVVEAVQGWLAFGLHRLLGPHDTRWWFGASDGVAFAASTVTAVLLVALVAAAFDHSVKRSTDPGSDAERTSTAGAESSPAGTK